MLSVLAIVSMFWATCSLVDHESPTALSNIPHETALRADVHPYVKLIDHVCGKRLPPLCIDSMLQYLA
jgi:hypothetical protein